VRIHVLITKGEPVSRENLVGALRRGHFFVGFDVLGDTTGFSFTAVNGADASSTVGDEVPFSDAVLIRIASPLKARLVLFRNGVRIRDEAAASELSLKPDGPGVYRVEAYLDGLESPYDAVPWVITNPIYVR
jgi:hypothetical protein